MNEQQAAAPPISRDGIVATRDYALFPRAILKLPKQYGPVDRTLLMALLSEMLRPQKRYPSQATLARETGVSEDTIRVHLAKLVKGGLVVHEKKVVVGGMSRDTYNDVRPSICSAENSDHRRLEQGRRTVGDC